MALVIEKDCLLMRKTFNTLYDMIQAEIAREKRLL